MCTSESSADMTSGPRNVWRGWGVFLACASLVFLPGSIFGQAAPSAPVLAQAQSLLRKNQPQQAIALLLSRGREVDPLKLRLALASAYTLLPDTVNARKEFDEAVQLAPDQSEVHLQYGRALIILADPGAARSELQRAIALNPSDGDSLYDLALLDARENQTAAAAALVERAIALTHDRRILRRYYTTEGQMYLFSQNWAAARESFDHALVLDKDAPSDLAGLGTALEGLNLPRDAVAVLAKAVTLDPKNAIAWEQLGHAQTDLGDCSAAATAYSHANELRPNDRSLLNHLAHALRKCGRTDEATAVIRHLKTIVEEEVALGAKGPELQRTDTEALALEQKGDYQAAELDYRKLIGIDPENPIFHRNLGLVLCRQSKWTEGLPELKKALALDPYDLDSQQALVAAESATRTAHPDE